MKSIVAEIILAAVVGVAAWAIVMMSGSAGSGAGATRPVRRERSPVTKPAGGGSFEPSDVAAAHWPIFRGSQALRGTARVSLGDSLKLIWTFRTGGPIKSAVAVGGGRVFAGSGDGNVYAVSLLDGRKLWSFPTGGPVKAPPLLLDGTVFVGSADSHLYAIDAGTGLEKWKYKTGAQITGSANWLGTPAGRRRILFGSYDKRLHCVYADDGEVAWTYETENFINGAPAVADGKASFGNCAGFVYFVNIADGALVRKIDSGAPVVSSPAVMGPKAYVGDYNSEVVCIDVPSGRILWRYRDVGGTVFSSPAVTADYVIFGSRDERVHCIDRATGSRVWVFRTAGAVDSSPVVCGDRVIVGSSDGRVYMLRLSDGQELWSYEIGQPITASPAVAAAAVIVGCEDGSIYAFGPK